LNCYFALQPGDDRNIEVYLDTFVFKYNLILITGV